MAGAAILVGRPFWRAHPVLAVYGCVAAALAGAAIVMLIRSPQTRRNGLLFASAVLFWVLGWASAHRSGPGPVVGEFSKFAWYLLGGVGVLAFPSGRLRDRADWLWPVLAAVVLGAGLMATLLWIPPDMLGYSWGAWWPHLGQTPGTGRLVRTAVALSCCVLGLALVPVAVAKLRRMVRIDRTVALPFLVLLGIDGAWAGAAEGLSCPQVLDLYPSLEPLADRTMLWLVGSFPNAFGPLGVLAVTVVGAFQAMRASKRVLDLTGTPTIQNIQMALRQALGDPGLEVTLVRPDSDRDASVAASPAGPSGTRRALAAGAVTPVGSRRERRDSYRYQIAGPDGRPVAVVDLDYRLVAQRAVVESALSTAHRLLVIAQAQADLVTREREVHRQVMRVETAQRQKLQRDLHDGAQQEILAVCARLGALETRNPRTTPVSEIRSCRTMLIGALATLRALAQGLYPSPLRHGGLGPALAGVAERLGIHLDLHLDNRRFPAEIESAMYFTLCEAIANAVKHSGATTITVTVRSHAGWLSGLVEDDGVGGARVRPGGGLAGIADRLRALGGALAVTSDDGQGTGTTVRVDIPCE